VAGYEPDACFAAFPSQAGNSGVKIATYAADGAANANFRTAFAQAFGVAPVVTPHAISDAQCGALAFIRDTGSYPSSKVALQLETDQPSSTVPLSGSIQGSRGARLYLLAVDTDGKVIDLDGFLAASGHFVVPVNFQGATTSKVQLLVAVASPAALDALAHMEKGTEAAAFFAALGGEAKARNIAINVAVQPFTMQ
jgi:serine/threonine-protein kinase